MKSGPALFPRPVWSPLVALLVVTAAAATLAPAAEEENAPAPAQRVNPSGTEPKAAAFSVKQGVRYVDDVALGWTRQKKCGSCHTSYPYVMARAAIAGANAPAFQEVRGFFENRVAHWDDRTPGAKPKWDTEVIATAQALASGDSVTTGTLHPLTRKALDRMWTVQRADGGFEWLKCDWPPLEHDDYYGALVAALGTGMAPQDYAHSDSARLGLERLRDYFRKHGPPDLHHQTVLLWASTHLEGLMTAEQKAQTVQQLRVLQKGDGGWCLPSLGHWKRRDGSANDSSAPSDGYATGLVLFVLREVGVPASDPAVERGVAWLKSNQRAAGYWFTRSLSDDDAHYITDVGSCLALMALWRCEPPQPQAKPVTATARSTQKR